MGNPTDWSKLLYKVEGIRDPQTVYTIQKESRRTAMSEKCYPQKGKRYVTASGEITGPLREGIMPGQFAFSCDHLHTSWHNNGVHAGFNNSKNLVRELEESKAPAPEADSTSDTPRTDKSKRKIDGFADEWVPRYVSEELERKLAQAIKERDEAKDGWGKELENSHRQHIHAEKLYNKAQQQLATATEALEYVVNAGDSTVMYRTAKQALAAIKQNQEKQP